MNLLAKVNKANKSKTNITQVLRRTVVTSTKFLVVVVFFFFFTAFFKHFKESFYKKEDII